MSGNNCPMCGAGCVAKHPRHFKCGSYVNYTDGREQSKHCVLRIASMNIMKAIADSADKKTMMKRIDELSKAMEI